MDDHGGRQYVTVVVIIKYFCKPDSCGSSFEALFLRVTRMTGESQTKDGMMLDELYVDMNFGVKCEQA